MNVLKKIRAKIDDACVNGMRIDGMQHLLIGLIMLDTLKYFIPMVWAAVITLAIMVGKELIYDKLLKQGTAEWHDVFWGIVGMILALF